MTIAELRKAAVRALGDGATVSCGTMEWKGSPLSYADADDATRFNQVAIFHRNKDTAMRALYAALREMGR